MAENKGTTAAQVANVSQEDYPLSAVPQSERRSLLSTSMVLLGFTFYIGSMYGGVLVGTSFGFWEMMFLIFLGDLVLGLYVALLGIIACKTGLNANLLSRISMGRYGSKIADFIFLFTQLGWSGWGAAMIAKTFQTLLPDKLGADHWFVILVFIVAILYSVSSFFGYKGLDYLSRFAVPAMLILILASIRIGLRDVGGWEGLMNIKPTTTATWGTVITIIVGTYVSGGTNATNWTRYAKTPQIAFWASIFAFLLGNGLMIFGGAWGALIYQQNDMVLNIASQGMMGWAIFLLIANTWSSQDNTYYITSISMCAFFNITKRRLCLVISVVIAIVMALSGVYEWMEAYLIWAGTFIPPIGGVIMGDYWTRWKGKMPAYHTIIQRNFNWTGIIAYFAACLVAKFSPGIASINGIVAAIICYWIVDKIFNAVGKPQIPEVDPTIPDPYLAAQAQ